MSVPILSLKITSVGVKVEKSQTFSRLLGTLSSNQKCFVRLE